VRADIFTMKTYSPKPEHIEHRWYVLDASGQVLGRLASEAAHLLRGKHKPIFAPHMDTGDHVIVVNADKVEVTGNKREKKFAYHHSGYPGGIKAERYDRFLDEKPEKAVERAVRGMLPKNRLGRQMIKKLHVIRGGEHPHAAQKPEALAVGERPVWAGLHPAAMPSKPEPRAKPKPEPAVAGDLAEESAAKPTARKSSAAKTTTTKSTAKKSTAKRAAATKSTATKSTAKKSTAKKSTAKKSTAKKSTAKKSTAKKSTAKKSTAKKSTAKKTTATKKADPKE
jgi:large subunit ribosomal protein L13